MNIDYEKNPEFLNDYIMHLSVVKGLAESTVMVYYLDIRQFLRFHMLYQSGERNIKPEMLPSARIELMTEEDIQKIILKDIYRYYQFLGKCENKSHIRSRKGSSLRSFFHYLTTQAGIMDHNPTENLEISSPRHALPKYLNLNESIHLLETKSGTNKAEDIRDYCILTLFLNCGLRLGELIGLNLISLDMEEQKMRIMGKGSKERIIYLNEACMDALQDYLILRKEIDTSDPALFLSKQKKRISRRRVQQIVETALKKAGLAGRGLSTHKLRHTAATLMYQQGGTDILTLRSILGHESVATTQIYTHLGDTAERDAMNRAPLAGTKRK